MFIFFLFPPLFRSCHVRLRERRFLCVLRIPTPVPAQRGIRSRRRGVRSRYGPSGSREGGAARSPVAIGSARAGLGRSGEVATGAETRSRSLRWILGVPFRWLRVVVAHARDDRTTAPVVASTQNGSDGGHPTEVQYPFGICGRLV